MASNLDKKRLLARISINLVLTKVSGIFRASTSFAYPERFSDPLGARNCLSPTNIPATRLARFNTPTTNDFRNKYEIVGSLLQIDSKR